MVLVLLACALRPGGGPATAEARALAEAETRWAARARPGEIEAAVDLWRGVIGADPDQPLALARLARAEWALGQRDPAAARPRFEAAQEYGWRCLAAWPGYGAALAGEAYRVTEAGAAALPAAAAPCLLWTAVAGLSLAAERGPGAALELEDVAVLLGRLDALAGEPLPEPLDPGFLPWARACLEEARAAPDPAPASARAAFAAAVAADPAVGIFRRDYARAFPDARDLAFAGFPPAGAQPWAAENAAWGRGAP